MAEFSIMGYMLGVIGAIFIFIFSFGFGGKVLSCVGNLQRDIPPEKNGAEGRQDRKELEAWVVIIVMIVSVYAYSLFQGGVALRIF